MKKIALLLSVCLLILTSCSRREHQASMPGYAGSEPKASISAPAAAADRNQQGQSIAQARPGEASAKQETVKVSVESQLPSVPLDRKIIRNGELSIELDDPAEGQRRIGAIAESLGGYVVTSESQQSSSTGSKFGLSVRLTVRVPSVQFAKAVEQIRATGVRVIHEKVTGQDVTEEFIDIEARLKAKKVLEAQFMEIMKRAQKVEDALQVQRQISEVRGEIEGLEGRRRFLENQSSLSTINIALQSPAPLVASAPGGFFGQIRSAFGDGVMFATEVILGVIRIVVALLPIALLLGLPAWALWHFALRRLMKNWLPKKAEAQSLQS